MIHKSDNPSRKGNVPALPVLQVTSFLRGHRGAEHQHSTSFPGTEFVCSGGVTKKVNNETAQQFIGNAEKRASVDLCAVGIIYFFVQTASSQSHFNSSSPKPSVL